MATPEPIWARPTRPLPLHPCRRKGPRFLLPRLTGPIFRRLRKMAIPPMVAAPWGSSFIRRREVRRRHAADGGSRGMPR
jgi:hypothetical protein